MVSADRNGFHADFRQLLAVAPMLVLVLFSFVGEGVDLLAQRLLHNGDSDAGPSDSRFAPLRVVNAADIQDFAQGRRRPGFTLEISLQ